ncbi:MAG: hypothetical protein GY839_21195 [candidate division Zixibacteria bacterium]|nr:hypothetical protein [candidate division Zixibacteria bacterium]
MMNAARISKVIAVIALLCFQLTFAGDKKPDWVQKHPISKMYYIGIAVAPKGETSKNYIEIAKDAALNNLASQITVNISGELIQRVVETGGIVEEDVLRQIRTSTKAELEGFELVDTWENDHEYWAYYRLSKSLYAEQKQVKLNNAIKLSLDLFANARENLKLHNIEKALQFYLQALLPIEKYIGEPLETSYEGDQIYLSNELYTSIQDLLSRIELNPVKTELKAKIGQPVGTPLELISICKLADSPEVGEANLPFNFAFSRGEGDLIGKVRADKDGKARCRISKIKAIDKIQIVTAELDLPALINYEEASIIIKGIVNSFAVPNARFVLYTSGLSVVVEAEEIHKGVNLEVPAIEPALKAALSEHGFTFSDSKAKCDLIITLKATSRDGSEIMGEMYSSFVDLTISVVDMASGDEIYKKSMHKLKGIDLSFDKAGLKAFKNAGDTVADQIVPELVEVIQR